MTYIPAVVSDQNFIVAHTGANDQRHKNAVLLNGIHHILQAFALIELKRVLIYCPLLQTTVLFAVPLKAAAKPLALRGQYERRLLVAKPPPAIHCRYCKTVDFAIEPSIIRHKTFHGDLLHLIFAAAEHSSQIKRHFSHPPLLQFFCKLAVFFPQLTGGRNGNLFFHAASRHNAMMNLCI